MYIKGFKILYVHTQDDFPRVLGDMVTLNLFSYLLS